MTRAQLATLGALAALATALAIAVLDEPVARWIAAHPGGAWWSRAVAALEYPAGIEPWRWTAPVALCAGVAACLAVPRWRPAARAWMYVALVYLLARNLMLWGKTLTGRLRPGEWLAQAPHGSSWGYFGDGASFPSGHVVIFAGLILPVAVVAPRARPLVAVIAFVMIARIAVGAHFVSDTLGGLALVAGLAAALAPLVSRAPAR